MLLSVLDYGEDYAVPLLTEIIKGDFVFSPLLISLFKNRKRKIKTRNWFGLHSCLHIRVMVFIDYFLDALNRLRMASLQGPVICPVVRAKQTGLAVPVNSPLLKAKLVRGGFLGRKGLRYGTNNVGYRQHSRKCRTTTNCSFSSSSNGNGSKAGNSNENDADYVNSSVVEAGT